jgi:hypothetical protein
MNANLMDVKQNEMELMWNLLVRRCSECWNVKLMLGWNIMPKGMNGKL